MEKKHALEILRTRGFLFYKKQDTHEICFRICQGKSIRSTNIISDKFHQTKKRDITSL